MKAQNTNTLSFEKNSLVELNEKKLQKINGGGITDTILTSSCIPTRL